MAKKGQHNSPKTEFKKGHIPWDKGTKGVVVSGMKGKHHSEESRKKISLANKGKPSWIKGKHHTEEAKMKNRLANLGKIPWIKGKHLSEEHKRKLSESHKGKVPWIAGKHHTEEAKRKMGLTHKGKPSPWKGKHPTPETLKRLSESHKGIIAGMLGKHFSEETKRKMSEIHNKRLSNPEEMKRQGKVSRKTILRLYASGAFPKQENTKPERQIKEELLKRGYKEGTDFIHQYKFMNKFMCDFCFPQQKVIIEAYGDFWHCNPKKYPIPIYSYQIKDVNKDKAKEAYIRKVDNGSWTLLIFWEFDINKDVSKCVDKIEEALRKKV